SWRLEPSAVKVARWVLRETALGNKCRPPDIFELENAMCLWSKNIQTHSLVSNTQCDLHSMEFSYYLRTKEKPSSRNSMVLIINCLFSRLVAFFLAYS
ncbi:hypothetical protein, partial [Vibrio sp.]|uniref:hypothetical protein n=1 Tax=Vibrio sp. TaxID=678 RepID=UPI003F6AE60A